MFYTSFSHTHNGWCVWRTVQNGKDILEQGPFLNVIDAEIVEAHLNEIPVWAT